jgi:folate-binding protein YgfZ
MRIDLDRFVAKDVAEQLQAFVFDEDVAIRDASDEYGRLSLHGAATLRALAEMGVDADGLRANLCVVGGAIDGREVWCARRDQTGEVGVELFCALADVAAIWQHVLEHCSRGGIVARPVGWSAYNAARIEGGTPLFLVDFGKSNLPHESGVLARRVSFKKGCYLGQEVVARMESLGKPKQMLRALRVQGEAIPVSGAQIFAPSADGSGNFGDCVGAITSSTPAPMLGAAGVAFGMIKTVAAAAGAEVVITAEGEFTRATIQDKLSFLPESTS